MLWIFPTAPKIAYVRIIRFTLTTILNEQHPCKRGRVDNYSALENTTDVTNLLVDELKISMENTGGDAYCLNIKNERHNRSIHNMVKSGLLDSNQHGKKCCCVVEISEEVHRCIIHGSLENISPHFVWYGKNSGIHELRTFGCDIYPNTSYPKKLDDRKQ